MWLDRTIRSCAIRPAGVLALCILLQACGGGASSSSAGAPAPLIQNLSYSPQSAYQGTSPSTVTIAGSITASTNGGGAIANFRVNLVNTLGQSVGTFAGPIQQGPVAGALFAFTVSVDVSQLDAGGFSLQFSVLNSAGVSSNVLSGPFSVLANPWTSLPSMTTPRTQYAVAEAGGKIYVLTGLSGSGSPGTPSTSVEVFDPVSNLWSAVSSSPTARAAASAVTANGKIYLIGGYNTASPNGIAPVDVYDPTTNMWSSVSPMPTPRYFAAGTAVGDEVYVIGGTQSNGSSSPLAIVESYSTTANLWTQRAALPQGRSSFAAASANGGIYISGGHTSPSAAAIDAAVLAFDPATNTWDAFNGFNRMIFTRADHALLAVPGGLLAVGGNSTAVFPNGPTAAVESTLLPALASPTNWKLKAPMPEPSAGLAAALTGGKVYVVTPTRMLSYSLSLDPP